MRLSEIDVYDFVIHSKGRSIEDLREYFPLWSESTIRKRLNQLVDEGLLRKEGNLWVS